MQRLVNLTRERIFAFHPKGKLIASTCHQLAAQQPLTPELLAEVRTAVTSISRRELERDFRIGHHLLDGTGQTLFGLVADAFAPLGIERADLNGMSWRTTESAIGNIRRKVSQHAPELWAAIIAADQLDVPGLIELRARVIKTLTRKKFEAWGLGGFASAPGMAGIKQALELSFPCLTDPRLASSRLEQLGRAAKKYLARAERAKILKNRLYWTSRANELLTEIIRAINPAFKEFDRLEHHFRQHGLQLTAADIDELTVGLADSRRKLRENTRQIWDVMRQVVTDSALKVNSPWVKKYSLQVFDLLLGKNWRAFLKDDVHLVALPTNYLETWPVRTDLAKS
jgi:hypothetical protein